MNKYNPQIHHRHSIRLKGYDYTQQGIYFITICTHKRAHLFGEVVDGKMVLNPFGRVVATYWQRIPRHFPHVQLGTWVVMPNHIHGLIIITDDSGGEAPPQVPMPAEIDGDAQIPGQSDTIEGCLAPTMPHGAPPGSVGAIVGNVKSTVTRRINQMRHTPGAVVWQRNYWESIVHTPEAYARVENYIRLNPARWQADNLHPNAPPNPYNQED